MKKVVLKSFVWLLLSVLAVSWRGEFYNLADCRFIEESSLPIRGPLVKAGTVKDHRGLAFADNGSESGTKGVFSKFDVAEIEEEHNRLHLNVVKKKLPVIVSFYGSFLALDRINYFPLDKEFVSFLVAASTSLSERYIIFRVLRI